MKFAATDLWKQLHAVHAMAAKILHASVNLLHENVKNMCECESCSTNYIFVWWTSMAHFIKLGWFLMDLKP